MPTQAQAGPELLSGPQALVAIREMVKDKSDLDLAVAYWGQGAVEALGLFQRKGATRILCDLDSLLCAPDELAALADRPNVEVAKIAGLHAKLYVGRKRLVTGSSNASASGLGFRPPSGDAALQVELNVQTRDAAAVTAAQAWFNAQWGSTRPLTAKQIAAFQPAWTKRQARQQQLDAESRRPRQQTLLDALDQDQALKTEAVRVLVYGPDTDADYDAFNAANAAANRADGLPAELDTVNSYYAADTPWPMPPGTWLIEFHASPRQRLKFKGMWRVRDARERVPVEGAPKWTLIRVCRVAGVLGYAVKPAERERIRDAAARRCNEQDWQPDVHGNNVDLALHELMRDYGG